MSPGNFPNSRQLQLLTAPLPHPQRYTLPTPSPSASRCKRIARLHLSRTYCTATARARSSYRASSASQHGSACYAKSGSPSRSLAFVLTPTSTPTLPYPLLTLLRAAAPTFLLRYPTALLAHSTMAEIRRKLVIVGDGACGKTCLLMQVPAAVYRRHLRSLPFCVC